MITSVEPFQVKAVPGVHAVNIRVGNVRLVQSLNDQIRIWQEFTDEMATTVVPCNITIVKAGKPLSVTPEGTFLKAVQFGSDILLIYGGCWGNTPGI